jgi:TfoX C-terminal domain
MKKNSGWLTGNFVVMHELRSLKNLGNTSVNWLNAVGVHDRADLERLGPVAAYNHIRQCGIKVSRFLLYAMQAALLDIHWSELDPALKRHLVEQADRHRDTAST